MNQISILISLYFSIFENEHFTNNLTNLNRLHVYTPTHTQRMTHSRETKGKRFVHNRTLPSIIHTHTFSNFVFYIFVTELIPTWSTTTPRFNLLWFLRLLPSFFIDYQMNYQPSCSCSRLIIRADFAKIGGVELWLET